MSIYISNATISNHISPRMKRPDPRAPGVAWHSAAWHERKRECLDQIIDYNKEQLLLSRSSQPWLFPQFVNVMLTRFTYEGPIDSVL